MENVTPAMLAERLRAEGAAVLEFFQGLDSSLWERSLHGEEGSWRLRDLLAHFITAEQGFLELLENVAAGGPGVPEGFDIDAYNNRAVETLKRMDSVVLLGQFAAVRERTAAVVAGLAQAQLDNRGRHPHLGEARLEEMIRLIFNHNKLHLREARKGLQGEGRA